MTPKYYKRLHTLAEHLFLAKLGHNEFNFNKWNSGKIKKSTGCGTAGCAVGECPFVFPEEWKFLLDPDTTQDAPEHQYFYPALIGAVTTEPIRDAQKFFGLTYGEADFLFAPMVSAIAPWMQHPLPMGSTRYDVAAGIMNFIAWKKKQPKGVA